MASVSGCPSSMRVNAEKYIGVPIFAKYLLNIFVCFFQDWLSIFQDWLSIFHYPQYMLVIYVDSYPYLMCHLLFSMFSSY